VGQKKLVRKAEPPSKRGMAWPRWTGFRGKTVWDWTQLLIVPVLLLLLTVVFTWQQNNRQEATEERRAQDLALQGYLDQMSTLVLEDLGDPKVQAVMRARTLTALSRLDAYRKSEVMQFLDEANLLHSSGAGEKQPVIALNDVDLHDAELFFQPDLTGAKLARADLSGAGLWSADLHDADLHWADLSGANLRGADLSEANLSEANLREADLSGADLSVALGITNEELEYQAASLINATMPNGQKYEDWLKDKKAREDEG
jgi:uncharacterized protein YjbI with pentapeptide repeats